VYLTGRRRASDLNQRVTGDEQDAAVPGKRRRPDLSGADALGLIRDERDKAKDRRREHIMSSISVIGSGNMASAIGALALKGGNAVEVMGRDAAKSAALARALGDGATAGTWGAAPAGDIVVLAVLFDSAVPVVSHFGDALDGKIIVDITNPFNPTATGLATPDGTSNAQLIAEAAPAGAQVVKAFNTIFRDVLAAGGPLDVFMAGDDAQAKASVSAFIESLGLRPRDAGDLSMAHWLEGAGLLSVGLARNGVGSFDFSLGVNVS
jgi:predicted dinucleotide-binding enzyme